MNNSNEWHKYFLEPKALALKACDHKSAFRSSFFFAAPYIPMIVILITCERRAHSRCHTLEQKQQPKSVC